MARYFVQTRVCPKCEHTWDVTMVEELGRCQLAGHDSLWYCPICRTESVSEDEA